MELEKVKDSYVEILRNFINELDVSFEYIENIKELKEYVKRMEEDSSFSDRQKEEYCKTIEKYDEKIYNIIYKKAKTADFEIMNDMKLFEGKLEMKIFKDENKNTKKNLIKHINSLYMVTRMGEMETMVKENGGKGIEYPKEMEGVMKDIIGNKEIMNIAQTLTKEFEKEKIDPMSLLTSLMTGKGDNRINKLVDKITKQLDDKFKNGELNETEITRQAETFMNAIVKK